MAILFGIIGLLLGALIFSDVGSRAFAGALVGASLGVIIGVIRKPFRQLNDLMVEVRRLRSDLEALQTGITPSTAQATEPPGARVAAEAAEPAPAAAAPAEPAAATAAATVVEAAIAEEAVPATAPVEPPAIVHAATTAEEQPEPLAPAAASPPSPPPSAAQPSRPVSAEPDFVEKAVAAFRTWLLGGNTVARIGIAILFLGLAFLLRYASERVTAPIELRYAGVAFAGLVLQVIGWRLRERNRTYGLVLQGGAIAVMYLTIFAAMRLHPLIPANIGFVLLVAVVVFSAILAVAQDSLTLAAAGAAGGFAAPLLASTGGEHHVMLFSYFALLNAGIFAISWFKAWRPLNLIGFVGTLGIGFAWGARSYEPEMFGTTEPFLVLFFLLYVAIGFLFARRVLHDARTEPPAQDRAAAMRWASEQADYIDGALLFGTPVTAFGLQYALIRHIELGTAFSALGLGLFYMVLAALLLRRTQWRYLALVEIYLALGAIFATLAVPLGLDARWTAAAWAVEGAGVYWIGIRQNRRVAGTFALVVQLGAAVSYVSTLRPGDGVTLVSGSRLGALMLGASLLFSYWQLHHVPVERRRTEDPTVLTLLVYTGLAFLYLLAPLSLRAEATAIAWAVGGVATMLVGLRLRDRHWMICAMLAQGLAGAVFILQMPPPVEGIGGPVFAAGFHGLFAAAMIGGLAVATFVIAAGDAQARENAAVKGGLTLLLLLGLLFLNLAVLFAVPWQVASAVWAGSGMVILLIGLKLQQRVSFGFGLVLQVVGGGAFLFGAYPALQSRPADDLTPLWHSGFWTPAAIALAAYVAGWLLFRAERNDAGRTSGLAASHFGKLSFALLVWATAWWSFAWLSEIVRFMAPETRPHAMMLVVAGSVAVWMLAARFWRWRGVGALCTLLIPAAILALALAYEPYYHPAAHLGAAAWLCLLVAHLLVLRLIPELLPDKWPGFLHIFGCWLFLGVLALEVRFAFVALSDHLNAWRWLGWASVPSLYLLAMTQRRIRTFWPFSAYPTEYCASAALPIALTLVAWLWLSNLFSDGAAEPLPYVPLLNPLDLGQLLVLFSLLLWLRTWFRTLPFAAEVPYELPYWLVGASGLFLLTCVVLRTAHHWAVIPYEADTLLASMLVQASLSIVWGITALSLMIAGHAARHRHLWIVGAILMAVVVIKLFLVEMLSAGGLPRIVSFIGIGALLLVIGYFAPLPPRRMDDAVEGVA
jgi:uncharacterized membrane protein